MEIQVSKPETRDQEPDLSSKSFRTIQQVISSCLILTSCFDSSFLSLQDFCLFNRVRLWNTLVASIPQSGDIFQCGTKELDPLLLSCCMILVTLLHLGGSLHRIELWHPPVKEENVARGHPKSCYWFQWVKAGCPELSIVHARAQGVHKRILETMRLTFTSGGSDTAKKSPLTNPDDT